MQTVSSVFVETLRHIHDNELHETGECAHELLFEDARLVVIVPQAILLNIRVSARLKPSP